MVALPGWIAAPLQQQLEHVARSDLRSRAQRISDGYRQGGNSAPIRSELDALAYAVVRMPATYAAVRAALAQAAAVIPAFTPRSLLDVGAGPGTASWAALDAWPTLQQATLVDSNPHLLALADHFGASPAAPPLTVSARRGTLATELGQTASADVVTASYVLTELPDDTLTTMLAQLWGKAERLLVIVEPGTPAGFRRVLACRDALLARGATIVAPCSHDGACPLAAAARWCHFSVRLPRSRDHRVTKDADVPFEDEKFCALVAGKGFGQLNRGRRVLATPRVGKAGVSLTLCAPEAVEERSVARRDGEAYRVAKRLAWGDAVSGA